MSKGSKRNKGRHRSAGTSATTTAPASTSASFTTSSTSTRTSSNMGGSSSSSADFSPPIPPDVAAQFFSQMAAIAKAKKQQQQQSSPSKPQPFGPSRPPSSGSSSTTTTSVSFGSLDLAALAQSGDFSAAAAAAAAAAASGGSGSSGASNGGGPPCSEAEVKALMGMFAEIMGMSMEATESTGSSKTTTTTARMSASTTSGAKSPSSGPVFMFGQGKTTTTTSSLASGTWSQGAMAAAARAASLYSEAGSAASSWGIDYYEDDFDDDDDDDDDYEDDSYGKGSSRPTTAIREEDWESLEQVAAEDESEAAERARKAAKKREKKQRKKERLRKEAAEKAALAAQKKRDKALQGWRSRIVQACQANDSAKVEALIGESPLKRPDKNHSNGGASTVETEDDPEAFVGTQVEFLLRSCIAKTPSHVEEPYEARHVLTLFAIHTSLPALFVNAKSGRNSLHSASMVGDYHFCLWVVEEIKKDTGTAASEAPENWINLTCQDSGWTALHYAVMSGSKYVMEVLLAAGANVKIRTDEVSTSNLSNGEGITPRELAECVLMGKHQDALEYSGSAMDELLSDALSNGSERRRYHGTLRQMIQRLTSIEHDGYSPSRDFPMSFENGVKDISATDETETARSSVQEVTAKKKRRKKKKNQQNQSAAAAAPEPAAQASPAPQPAEDPMITALLGMGFAREQIDEAVKACGGTNRATADDLVMWIFEQQAGGPIEDSAVAEEAEQETIDEEALAAEREKQHQAELARKEEEAKRAAERLAAKKEEQRRRNREWNNREQARQREEQQAKLKKAVELRARADAYHAAMAARNRTVKYTQAAPVGPGFGNGPPPAAVPHMIQKQHAVVPKTILQPPRNTGLVGGVPGMNGVKNSPSSAKKGKAGNGKANIPNGVPDTSPHKNGMKKSMESPVKLQGATPMPSEQLVEATESAELATEDGNGSVASSVQNGPPGFTQPQGLSGPPGLQESASASSHNAPALTGYQPDMNATGEMRATARAFVPSNFTPPPSQHTTPALKPIVPLGYGPPETLVSTPSFDTIPAATSSLSVTQPAQTQQSSPNDSLLEPLSSMLSGSVAPPLSAGHVALFERNNTVTPSSTHSATSSVTGVTASTANEEPALPPGMGFGLDSSKSLNVNPLLFDSAPVPASNQSVFAGTATSSVIPGASLWGGGGVSLGQPAPVAGLNLGSALGVDDKQSSVLNSSWSAANQANGANNSNTGGGTTMPSGLGSIW